MKSLRFAIAIVLLVPTAILHGGDRSNVRGMGMARTLIACSRGTEALGINPANLALHGRSPFSLSLAPFGFRISTELFSYDIYQEYFTGVAETSPDGTREPRYLTNEDKDRILGSLPEGVGSTRFDFEAMALGVSLTTEKLGGFGLSVVDRAGALVELPRDYVRFFLYGLDSTGSQYVFDGTGVSAWWWREYNVSYGFRIPIELRIPQSVYVGLGVKFLRGYGMMETQRYAASLANRRVGANQYQLEVGFDYLARRSGVDFLDQDKEADFTPFPEPAGKGTGFDIGVSAQVMPGLFVAASVTDIGSIRWERNVVQTDGHYTMVLDDPFEEENVDSLERALRGTNHAGESFSTSLPTALRLGVAVESDDFAYLRFLPGRMLLALDYNQGLNSSMGNTTRPRVSIGMEYRLVPFLPLRTGLSLGGGDGVRWAAGFGLDFYYLSFDLATENFGLVFSPKDFQMFSIAAGLRVRI